MTDVQRRRVDREATAVRGRGSAGTAANGGAGEGQVLSAAGLAQGLTELVSGSFRAGSSFQFDNLGVSPYDAENLSSAISAVEAMRTIDLALRGTTVELTTPLAGAVVPPLQQQQQQYNQSELMMTAQPPSSQWPQGPLTGFGRPGGGS